MAKKLILSEEQKNDMIELYRSGINTIEISKKVGISPSQVSHSLKKWNVLMNLKDRINLIYRLGKHKPSPTCFKKGDLRVLNRNKYNSPETRLKMSETRIQRIKEGKITNYWKGKKMPQYLIDQWSNTHKQLYLDGRKCKIIGASGADNIVSRPDIRKKISDKNKGKHYSSLTEFKKGEEHPFWLGGDKEYSQDFNRIFKEAVRVRDAFMCLKCGMREEDSKILLKRKLDIHHIDYVKKNTTKENCCALCLRCNLEVNMNRPQWTKFFQSILSERYGYDYSNTNFEILPILSGINGGCTQ